jgi:uncharacterized membrane protein
MFMVLFLSGGGRLLGIPSQYLASVIPVLFVAFVYGLVRLKKAKNISIIVLGSTVFFNILLSPSPVSQVFLRGKSVNFSYKAYASGEREKMIKSGINKYIPADPKVSIVSQNSLYLNHFAKREYYDPFPNNIANCDYIVLDFKRPLYALDVVNEKEYFRNYNIAKRTRTVLYQNDGFCIFGKKLRLQ